MYAHAYSKSLNIYMNESAQKLDCTCTSKNNIQLRNMELSPRPDPGNKLSPNKAQYAG